MAGKGLLNVFSHVRLPRPGTVVGGQQAPADHCEQVGTGHGFPGRETAGKDPHAGKTHEPSQESAPIGGRYFHPNFFPKFTRDFWSEPDSVTYNRGSTVL